MGKMGEAANLGMVAIAAYVVYRLAGLKLPSFELPQIPWTLEFPGGRDPDYYRRRKEEILGNGLGDPDDSNLDEPIWEPTEHVTVKELQDKLAVFTDKSVHFREVIVSHEARAVVHEEYFAAAIPDVTSRIEALQTTMAELSALVPRPTPACDAGGSPDLGYVYGGRRYAVR